MLRRCLDIGNSKFAAAVVLIMVAVVNHCKEDISIMHDEFSPLASSFVTLEFIGRKK